MKLFKKMQTDFGPCSARTPPGRGFKDAFACRDILRGTGIALLYEGCHPFGSEAREDRGNRMLGIFAENGAGVSPEKLAGRASYPARASLRSHAKHYFWVLTPAHPS